MGQFSWIYSDTHKPVINDRETDTYLLVPEPFQKKYGKAIYENCYSGYGDFGGYNVYELVALWNRNCLPTESRCQKKPLLSDYYVHGKEDAFSRDAFNSAIKRWEENRNKLVDFASGMTVSDMKAKYGNFCIMDIGLYIACYDDDNAALKYPIKITSKIMDYADVEPSLGDPHQGWGDWEDVEYFND